MRRKAWKRVSLKFRSVLQVVSFSGAAEAVGFVYGGTGFVGRQDYSRGAGHRADLDLSHTSDPAIACNEHHV